MSNDGYIVPQAQTTTPLSVQAIPAKKKRGIPTMGGNYRRHRASPSSQTLPRCILCQSHPEKKKPCSFCSWAQPKK
jgi:hypothetical protein